MPHASAVGLLSGVVDYAGLFPPAALSMLEAVDEYRRARGAPEAWMLGRFVGPAARLSELAAVLSDQPADGWRVSAIVRSGSASDAEAVRLFNAARAQHGARVDSVESKPETLDGIGWMSTTFPPTDFEGYVEIAPGPDARAWLTGAATSGLRGKVRTGGVTADAFPAPDALARFLAAAVRHGVRFKATAGLHHALRGRYRLTYDEGAAEAPMYGYVNVLLATVALRLGRSVDEAEALLTRTDASTLTFTETDVQWGADVYPLSAIEDTRAHHIASFGSCSFREPAGEFGALARL